jgi:hypothetical protein
MNAEEEIKTLLEVARRLHVGLIQMHVIAGPRFRAQDVFAGYEQGFQRAIGELAKINGIPLETVVLWEKEIEKHAGDLSLEEFAKGGIAAQKAVDAWEQSVKENPPKRVV